MIQIYTCVVGLRRTTTGSCVSSCHRHSWQPATFHVILFLQVPCSALFASSNIEITCIFVEDAKALEEEFREHWHVEVSFGRIFSVCSTELYGSSGSLGIKKAPQLLEVLPQRRKHLMFFSHPVTSFTLKGKFV